MAAHRKTVRPGARLAIADGGCPCPTNGVIELVGKRWTLCIIARVGQMGPVRFNDLQDSLPGISPRTLSDTLKELQRHGVLHRVAYAEVPPRVEYTLTEKGRALVASMAPLMAWAQGHDGACCAGA